MSETIFLGCGKVKDPERSVIDGNFVPVAIFQGDGQNPGEVLIIPYTVATILSILDNHQAGGDEPVLAHALNDLMMVLETGEWERAGL